MRSDLIARINTDHLVSNCRALGERCGPGVKVCAVLKADAYGHGIEAVAPALQAAGVDCAGVATLQEAITLRSVNWHRSILLFGGVLAVTDERERLERIRAIVKHRLTLTVTDQDTVNLLAKMNLPSPIEVHIKVDTGMGRMGAMPDAAIGLVQTVRASRSLRLVGFYSHFATADFEQPDLARRQLSVFNDVLSKVGDFLPRGVVRHLANSAATITMPEAHFDMVRPGLALYGYPPAEHLAEQIKLKPILRLVSHLTAVKELPAGCGVGYGRTFVTRRPSRLGIVPIGYYDGFLRSLSNAGVVGTAVGDAPVIGRVSMDQLAVDLTDLPPLEPGAEVVLIDDRPDRPNSVAAIARRRGTIPYEITCLLGRRIQRVAIGNSCASSPGAVPPL
jgi:alanine racemase